MRHLLGENLVSALRIAIDAQSIQDKARLAGKESGIVQGWREILDAVEHGEPITLVPVKEPKSRQPPPKRLARSDLVAAASKKGARVVGDVRSGELQIEAPDGFKWNGELHSMLVYYNPKDPKDMQAAFRDAVERIEQNVLCPIDDEGE